jgi:hypothetical protein
MPGDVNEHGSRASYDQGCRCLPCTQANSAYQRHYRAHRLTGVHTRVSKREDPILGDVVAFPTGAEMKSSNSICIGQVNHSSQRNLHTVGSVDQAVLDETASLLKSSERPAMVACARALAHILDNDALVAMHPQAARQPQAILNELHSGPKKKSKGRLAVVQQMTRAKRGN